MSSIAQALGLHHLRAFGLGKIHAGQRASASSCPISISPFPTRRAPRAAASRTASSITSSRAKNFEQMIQADEFLEHANVFGNCYGTARRFLREAETKGHDLLLDIDVQGARQIKRKLPDAISIFVLPPDRKTLEWRLRNRSEDPEDVIQRRLINASARN